MKFRKLSKLFEFNIHLCSMFVSVALICLAIFAMVINPSVFNISVGILISIPLLSVNVFRSGYLYVKLELLEEKIKKYEMDMYIKHGVRAEWMEFEKDLEEELERGN